MEKRRKLNKVETDLNNSSEECKPGSARGDRVNVFSAVSKEWKSHTE